MTAHKCHKCGRYPPCYYHLPKKRGQHYFLSPTSDVPAIFLIENHKSPDRGKWMVCPVEEDVPFDRMTGHIMAFDTPEEALRFLRRLVKSSQV